jgi:hypothetical protein
MLGRHMREWMCSSIVLYMALDGDEKSASGPCRFTPRETAPSTHYVGDWVGPKAHFLCPDSVIVQS